MIINFSFYNFKSFKEEADFSMIASSKKESRRFNDTQNKTLWQDKLDILLSAAIYGSNASGKSNFIEALGFMQSMVLSSQQHVPDSDLVNNSFKLNTSYSAAPSSFELQFALHESVYTYGFRCTKDGITEEYLKRKTEREATIFERSAQSFSKMNHSPILRDIVKKNMVHSKALLLSMGTVHNDPLCVDIYKYFVSLKIMSGIHDFMYSNYTLKLLSDPLKRNKIIDLLKFADFGITDIAVEEKDAFAVNFRIAGNAENDGILREPSKVNELYSKRYVLNDKNELELIQFPFNIFESEGTKKFLNLAGPIVMALEEGSPVVVDELDVKLHPELTTRIIGLFQNNKTNPRHAQLIFTTHNTNLLSASVFRRDQVWFTDKNGQGESTLYALSSFKKEGKSVRNDEPWEQHYLEGRYGGVPFLGDFDNFLEF